MAVGQKENPKGDHRCLGLFFLLPIVFFVALLVVSQLRVQMRSFNRGPFWERWRIFNDVHYMIKFDSLSIFLRISYPKRANSIQLKQNIYFFDYISITANQTKEKAINNTK